MTHLVRDALIPLLNKVSDANSGLLMQRGLRVWQGKETKGETDKSDKTDLINVITAIRPSDLYQLAFDRWLLHTYQGTGVADVKPQLASVNAKINGRLYTGLALGGTLETGVTTQHGYGMPMLAGSSVKGAVKAYAETLFSQKDATGKIILEKDKKGVERSIIDPQMQPILDVLFGTGETATEQNAGYLIWHDAWWIPAFTKEGKYSANDDAKPFVSEIVTVHHQKYYSDPTGRVEALDMESPIPNQQLAVQGSFYFVIEGEEQWVKTAKQLLENMLQHFGMGAKAASGYGYFQIDETLNKSLQKRYALLKLDTTPSDDGGDPYHKVRIYLSSLDEKELIESLSRNLNKLFKEFDLDKANNEHCKNIANIVVSSHKNLVDAWKSDSGNKERAFKFIEKNKA